MTEQELIDLLTARFYENFADKVAGAVLRVDDAAAFDTLYELVATGHKTLPRNVRHTVCFRGAYVLERIYFSHPELFAPYAERFCRTDFPVCQDPSARRHFTKLMSDLLRRYEPDAESLERIADAAAQWAVDPKMKVAVRIRAVDVLLFCRGKVEWVADAWDDIIETISHDATPAIMCRLRNGWRRN